MVAPHGNANTLLQVRPFSMNAIHEPNPWSRFLAVLCCSIALLSCFGCASYFRTGDMSYQELNQKNQEKRKENQMFFKPGTVFYAR
jgi:hypothetical protein